jgi:SAM-dependent methyltransferase
MGFYAEVILPKLCHFAKRNRHLLPYRERVIGEAQGRVLEIGMGSGLNLRSIGRRLARVRAIIAARCDGETRGYGIARSGKIDRGSAESIPLDDKSIAAVVTTWALCSIPHAETALNEMRRVLRSGGKLLFVEHGLAPEEGVRNWQNFLTPAWKRISGGCHFPIERMIETAGFRLDRLETGYIPGSRPMTFFYEGSARPN